MTKNFPWTTVVVLAILVTALIVLSLIRNESANLIIPVLVGLIPGLLAAGYAERTNRDVRNGVVQHKAKEGAKEALAETGVTAVVNNSASASIAYTDALNTHTAALKLLVESNAAALNTRHSLAVLPENKDGA